MLLCCNRQQAIDSKWLPKGAAETVVILQPLSAVPNDLLLMLKDSIPNFYPVSVRIAKPVSMPLMAYYKPRNRYKADSILAFLQQIKPAGIRIVAGITALDISTRKDTVNDYGVMGFGLRPGYVCVVSTFRLVKDTPSQPLLFQRTLKTIVHELGHNFGLLHCTNKHCIMADAKGKLNQDNETGLCAKCRKMLNLH
jgi:archaemetzincin